MEVLKVDFYERVTNRWQLPEHSQYAHLQNQPERVASQDTLLSIDFAGPNVAHASLRIGYPPVVYMDSLSLLRLADGRWFAEGP